MYIDRQIFIWILVKFIICDIWMPLQNQCMTEALIPITTIVNSLLLDNDK